MRIAITVLAAAAALSVGACGKKADDTSTSTTTTATTPADTGATGAGTATTGAGGGAMAAGGDSSSGAAGSAPASGAMDVGLGRDRHRRFVRVEHGCRRLELGAERHRGVGQQLGQRVDPDHQAVTTFAQQ